MTGYCGKVLRVDLSTRKIVTEDLSEEWCTRYIGAKGIGYRYMLQDVPAGTDPLGPENEIIFMTGPFAGTIVPTSSRMAVVTKSPLTGAILMSLVGGSVGPEFKYAGYDGVIISGRASAPVFLYITNEHVTIENARALWGKGIFETDEHIQSKGWTYQAKTLIIGPAGENLVPFSCIGADAYHQAGRGGAGAVMGSKNLKAIAIKGQLGVRVDNMPEFLTYIESIRKNDTLSEPHLWADTDGTPMVVDLSQFWRILPTLNFTAGQYENAGAINSDAVKSRLKKKRACMSCPLGCGRFTQALDGTVVEGPEYETIALAGSNCGLGSIDGLIRFNKLCDDVGIDTISTGAILAFAMEATERGIFDFGIRFGEEERMLQYVSDIAFRRGVGADLALGVKRLAAKIGAESIALEVKGMELPGYEPRASFGQALAYATSDRGACHQRAFAAEFDAFGKLDPFTFEGKAALVKQLQDLNAAKDALVICDMWRPSVKTVAELYTRVTGLPMTEEEFMRCGERIWNLSRLFNEREGFRREDDNLAPRIFNEPLLSGRAAGKCVPKSAFDASLRELYALRRWDADGKPLPEALEELGIDAPLLAQLRGDVQ
jgi:aldehyde:ferredoxin oxidoreductase